MTAFETMVEKMHEASGYTGKELMELVFTTCYAEAMIKRDVKAQAYFRLRMKEIMAQ